VSNGAVALVVTSPERARSLRQPPVHVLGVGQASPGDSQRSDRHPWTETGAGPSGRQALGRAGVALADVDAVGLADIAGLLPGPVLTRVVDVADVDAVRGFADDVEAWRPGPLGAVINNAGVAVVSPVARADPDADAWLHAINFGGVVNGTRAFLPVLLRQRAGTVANLSSVFGLVGMPSQSAYCAAKFAVRGFTEALRHELRGTGVRAAVVHPGGVRTAIARNSRFSAAPGEPGSMGPDREQFAAQFAAIAMTSPERAARIIVRGIEHGRARILVGPDAYALDALARVAPTHYFDVIAAADRIGPRLLRRLSS
jgi:short-subunit dehydrogenase